MYYNRAKKLQLLTIKLVIIILIITAVGNSEYTPNVISDIMIMVSYLCFYYSFLSQYNLNLFHWAVPH